MRAYRYMPMCDARASYVQLLAKLAAVYKAIDRPLTRTHKHVQAHAQAQVHAQAHIHTHAPTHVARALRVSQPAMSIEE